MKIICECCNLPIENREDIAHGRGGAMHRRCGKLGTAHGEAIDLLALYDKLTELSKRVSDLEIALDDAQKDLRHHHDNIPFRIGGGA